MQETESHIERFLKIIHRLVFAVMVMVLGIVVITLIAVFRPDPGNWFKSILAKSQAEEARKESFAKWEAEMKGKEALEKYWKPLEISGIADSEKKALAAYGKELISHTAKYLGPKGSVAQISNGMNCQNCHLDAGTRIWGNNYGGVFSTYPKYRARSGTQEDIYKRINDCLERSLNGKPIPNASKEMQAMKTYIEFIGGAVAKGSKPEGAGIYDLPYPERALDKSKGRSLFATHCERCHQANGEGLLAADKVEYIYPPLWGSHAYNVGAGLFRMSRFAGYIKYNMPQGVTFQQPILTDEEAWDIAGFVNSQPRPYKDPGSDWPKISEKPVDHPFGPYADRFSAFQHKYGPYKPIADEKKKQQTIQNKNKSV